MNDQFGSAFDLTGKVSLVTGSARGIGRGMAFALARAGSDLMLVDILEKEVAETAAEVGKIINLASLTSRIGVRGISCYGVSKGGVYALTKGLAVELAEHGICVNAIAPGFFTTDLTSSVWNDDGGWMAS